MITVHIEGSDLRELQRDLRDLHPDRLLKDDMRNLGRGIVQTARRYPTPRTSYKRTGFLARSWAYFILGNKLHIENKAKYVGYVMGDEQTQVHKRHGWQKIRTIIDKQTEKMLKAIEREIDKIWRH